MSVDTGALKAFFQVVYGTRTTGYVCLAYTPDLKNWTEEYFEWPRQASAMVTFVSMHYGINHLYYCPQLLTKRKRAKVNIEVCSSLWADLDTCRPDLLIVQPNILVESSPGRWQAVWSLEEEVHASIAENFSMRIAYFHAAHGADRSGWDLGQLLRIPGSFNFKYGNNPFDAPTVTARRITVDKFKLPDFEGYPPVRGSKELTLPLPETPITEDPVTTLERHRYRLNPTVFGLFSVEPEGDWSTQLWKMQLLCFEAGMSREEVFHVSQHAACNKYTRDNKPIEFLWRDVCRAYIRHQENVNSVVLSTEIQPIISDQELKDVSNDSTFVEQYISWASSVGDAAPAYHQAGAFVALSALLSGNIRIPTSWGNILPNLWFMILGDTTLTRKSTAMDMSMGLIDELDQDIMLATDGSIEGLLTAMSLRPGRPSVFLRDEFSGLLSSISKKDYYAGMGETLTKMYDGKPMKRILRKEVVKVDKPILIIFAGGIRSRVQSLLTHEDVSSGFIPRFCFLTAESDVQRVRPLGPPSVKDMGARDFILGRMRAIKEHYDVDVPYKVDEDGVQLAKAKQWDVALTPDAWARYNKLEKDMLDAAVGTALKELIVPLYSRLAVSTLKAAALIAASRQFDDKVIVDEEDIVRAIKYGTQWREFGNQIVNGIGKTGNERELDKVLNAILATPGISRGKLMQNYHLTKRAADAVFGTLVDRGQIVQNRVGNGWVYFPVGV